MVYTRDLKSLGRKVLRVRVPPATQKNDSLKGSHFYFRIGWRLATIPMAVAIMTTFFIIYCPSSVGRNQPDQVTSRSIKSGRNVVIMWRIKSRKAARSAPLIRKSIPINSSSTPNKIKNVEKGRNEMVCSNKFLTSGVAGL